MEKFVYKPKGVCSREMHFNMDGDTILSVNIIGGCAGNLLGISKIITNKKISEVISVFEGVQCGNKATSCPDQISEALKAYAVQHHIVY